MIDEAERELAVAASRHRPGRFQLEAAIQSVHADRRRTARTDWPAIALLYEGLVRLSPAFGAQVGRAAAVAEVHGSERGLALLDALDGERAAAYQPYWAVRAHLTKRAGMATEADAAYQRAIELTDDPAVKRYLRETSGVVEIGTRGTSTR
jgi:RNA polymerase sigma-70 factor (ECF subfamily)